MKKKIGIPDYIAAERTPVAPPFRLVNCGKAAFGTFNAPIPDINMIDAAKPCGPFMPDFMKRSRLTAWEAFEIAMDEGILVSAVYNMGGSFGFSICSWFDKSTKKVSTWINPAPGMFAKVADNLIDSTTKLVTPFSSYVIENHFQNHTCTARCSTSNPISGKFAFDMSITGLSPASIVSIPFDTNKPLYSQKEFFKAEGTVTVGGKTFRTNERSVVIIDDHKGFYPFFAHYDWVTSFGLTEIKGKQQYIAFNLTANQSTDADRYNENILWLEGRAIALPPVAFTHENDRLWHAKDAFGQVDITFEIDEISLTKVEPVVNYALTYGKIKGTIKDYDGTVYDFTGMDGIGEDKTTRI
jgi:hypothetical protein